MKYEEAKKQLKHALDNQKTISTPKLKILMESLKISIKHDDDKQVRSLKNEIRNLRKRIRRLENK